MRRLGEAVSSFRLWKVGTLLSLFLVPAFATSAVAQIIIGDVVRPQVEVDNTVLDRLGKEPTLPDLFLGGSATGKSFVNETAIERTPGKAQPTKRIVLKKPAHKITKPKTAVAAVKKTPPVAPPTSVVQTAPATAPVAEASSAIKPAETPKAAEQPLPTVSLPVVAAKDRPSAIPGEGGSEVKSGGKIESALPSAAKVEPPPEVSPPPVDRPKTPTVPPTPANAAPQPLTPTPAPTTALTAATPQASAPAVPAPVAAEPSVPTTTAKAPALPAITVPTLQPSAQDQQEAHLTQTVPSAGANSSSVGIEPPLAIPFDRDGARLPDNVKTTLSQLADRLASDATLQIQILAYADGDEDNASKARRLSLSRALAVRSILIDQGVRSTRIEVRALGNKVPEGPPDRVDVLLQRR
jgi:outer membrane protein OmpA-like peptidoglycan-associated protein